MAFDRASLCQFTGTVHHYRHALCRQILFTDGVKYVADEAGAHWLVDKIASLQLSPKLGRSPFQAWKLEVVNEGGKLVCEDGNGGRLYDEDIVFTDFPAPGIELWLVDSVILLPSEY